MAPGMIPSAMAHGHPLSPLVYPRGRRVGDPPPLLLPLKRSVQPCVVDAIVITMPISLLLLPAFGLERGQEGTAGEWIHRPLSCPSS